MLGCHCHQENYFDFQLMCISWTKPLYPSTDTKNWKTSRRLFLLPVCEVLIILKHHRHPGAVQFPVAGKPLLTSLPPASLACFTFKSIRSKGRHWAHRTSWRCETQRWRISTSANIHCKSRVNKNGIISASANSSEGVTEWTGVKSTAFPRVF